MGQIYLYIILCITSKYSNSQEGCPLAFARLWRLESLIMCVGTQYINVNYTWLNYINISDHILSFLGKSSMVTFRLIWTNSSMLWLTCGRGGRGGGGIIKRRSVAVLARLISCYLIRISIPHAKKWFEICARVARTSLFVNYI